MTLAELFECCGSLIALLIVTIFIWFTTGNNKIREDKTFAEQKQGGNYKISIEDKTDKPEIIEKGPIVANSSFDEYEDIATYEYKMADVMSKIKNIVVDGANFIHYIKKPNENFNSALQQMVTILLKQFKNKKIYIVLKDDGNGYDTNLVKKLATKSINIIICQGDGKARDDYIAILLADKLGDDTILLSRDRYRNMSDIAKNSPDQYTVYGDNKAEVKKNLKIKKMQNADSDERVLTNPQIGRWSIDKKHFGFASNSKIDEGFWFRIPLSGSDSSRYSFVFHDVSV